MTFQEFNFEPALMEGIDSMNFVEATPIQELTIPPLLNGKDLLGVAQTGTGKTAAYLLPIMNRIYKGEFPAHELKAVIVVPTRELAIQIDRQVQGFGYFVGISSMAIYGGTDGIVWEQQVRSLQRGVDIVVATPGRLIDLLNIKETTIHKAQYLVIDEADRMLDMGFYEDIITIRKQLASNCQLALFSATMPQKITLLADQLLSDPVKVELAISKPPESIKQYAYVCYESQKLPLVISLFETEKERAPQRTVIFVSSIKKALDIAPQLKKRGLNVAQMHSDLDQKQREEVLRNFKSGAIAVLVATDIVARGIDITDIETVVNFDMPRDNEDYVHRIGRTARGSSSEGTAITFVTDRERRSFDELQHFLGKSITLLSIPESLGDAPSYSYTPKSGNEKERAGDSSKRRNDTRRRSKYPRRKKETTSHSSSTVKKTSSTVSSHKKRGSRHQ